MIKLLSFTTRERKQQQRKMQIDSTFFLNNRLPYLLPISRRRFIRCHREKAESIRSLKLFHLCSIQRQQQRRERTVPLRTGECEKWEDRWRAAKLFSHFISSKGRRLSLKASASTRVQIFDVCSTEQERGGARKESARRCLHLRVLVQIKGRSSLRSRGKNNNLFSLSHNFYLGSPTTCRDPACVWGALCWKQRSNKNSLMWPH